MKVNAPRFNVLYSIVNYRTDEDVVRLVRSLHSAWMQLGRPGRLRLFVVDNSGKSVEAGRDFLSAIRSEHQDVELAVPPTNVGYFGALPLVQARSSQELYDYIVISNADLVVEGNFFEQLVRRGKEAALIAPSILVVTPSGVMDQNPAYEVRLSRFRLRMLRRVYGNAALFTVFRLGWQLRDWMRVRRGASVDIPEFQSPDRQIYAAHGAMFIFSDARFFQGLDGFAPFLFGEEIFVAEEALRAGVRILYAPAVRVRHARSISMNRIPQSRQRRYLFDALTFILNRYYLDSRR